MENAVQYILTIASGLAVTIPVVIQLVKYFNMLVQEKKWDQLMKEVLKLMVTAEQQFEKGSVKKDYVLVLAKTAAEEIGVDFDEEKIGEMIDAMVEMSKMVNAKKDEVAT